MSTSAIRKLSRREMLRLGAGTLLSLGVWPGRLRAGEASHLAQDFTFIAVNDLHYREDACRPWFENVVKEMRASAPRAELGLLGGDLADDGTAAQLSSVREIFHRLGIPVHAVIGNHDYITDQDRSAYERLYPNRLNYWFEHRGWQFVALDTTQGRRATNASIQPPTFRWLNENLGKLQPNQPTILLTHFPLGDGMPAQSLNADDLLGHFLDFNLRAVFCGHYHGYTQRAFHSATITTDRCCSRVRNNHDFSPQKGWFVCRTIRGEVQRRFVQFIAPA
jgi:calcineurin-like phosphoesterase family protein